MRYLLASMLAVVGLSSWFDSTDTSTAYSMVIYSALVSHAELQGCVFLKVSVQMTVSVVIVFKSV